MPISERIRTHLEEGGEPPVLSTDDCVAVLNDLLGTEPAHHMTVDQRHGLNLVINALWKRGLK